MGHTGQQRTAKKTFGSKKKALKVTKGKTQRAPKLKKNIGPGSVLILLAGRFRGRRVVFVKQLPSGLLLCTGPYSVNGVPLKRVDPRYCIGTSARVKLCSTDFAKIDDAYFAKDAKAHEKRRAHAVQLHTQAIEWCKNLLADDVARHDLCDKEFEAADADGSGSLDPDEVADEITKICQGMAIKVPKREKMDELVKKCIKEGDANLDGMLQKKEFRKAFTTTIKSCLHEAEREDKEELAFFEASESAKAGMPQAKKDLQKKLDEHVVKELGPDMAGYLRARFSLRSGQYPHEMKF